MALDPVSRDAVLAAMSEYDQIGKREFLGKYGFGSARRYLVLHDGKAYDSKAILGAAYAFDGRKPMRSEEFSGGKSTVVPVFKSLGFTVVDRAQMS